MTPWFKRKLNNFPAIVQQTFLYLCVRTFMQIKAAKELRVALISVWHPTPKHWPCFMSTDTLKPVLNQEDHEVLPMHVQLFSDFSAKSQLLNMKALVSGSDSESWANDSTRVTILGDSDSTRVRLKKMTTRLESRFSQHDSTRITVNDSRLESGSFLQNFRVPDGQTQFVCTQRNEDFLLQWWSRLGESFCFDCLVVLCCILRIKCPQLA